MLLIPALGAVYVAHKAASTYDERLRAVNEAHESLSAMKPVTNQYSSHSFSAQNNTLVPRRVIPDHDLRGVPMYHVDYGDGSLTKQYMKPNVLIEGGHSSQY